MNKSIPPETARPEADLEDWITKPTTPLCNYYLVCKAAEDFNTIASHVGSPDKTNCCQMYAGRIHGMIGCGSCHCCYCGLGDWETCTVYCCNPCYPCCCLPCCGPPMTHRRLQKLKDAYEQKHHLKHRPSLTFYQKGFFDWIYVEAVMKEHEARFGAPMKREMER